MKAIMRWFWVPVREGENWAQTLVRVAGNLFRSLLTITILGALAITASIQFQNATERQTTDQRERITVTANTDATNRFYACDAEFPVSVAVMNNSDQTLMSMEIELSARARGTSTNVLSYGARTIHWDQIVPPRHALAMCYRLGDQTVVANLVVIAEPRIYSMELRPTEDWMLSETRAFTLPPPCEDGASSCEPWERNWGNTRPTVGTTVSEDGVLQPPSSE